MSKRGTALVEGEDGMFEIVTELKDDGSEREEAEVRMAGVTGREYGAE